MSETRKAAKKSFFQNRGLRKEVSGSAEDMEKALRAREAMEKAHKEKKQGKTSKASNFFGRLFED